MAGHRQYYDRYSFHQPGHIQSFITALLSLRYGGDLHGALRVLFLRKASSTGNASDSIVFTATDPIAGWHGFRFINTNNNGQDSARMYYCIIEHGIATGYGVNLAGSMVSFALGFVKKDLPE